MASLGDLTVALKAQTADFDKKFADAGKALRDFERASKNAEKVQKELQAAATGAAEAAKRQGSAVSAALSSNVVSFDALLSIATKAAAGVTALFNAAEEGARISSAEKYFTNAGKSIEGFRAATRGLISDADLVKKSNLADSMGLTTETFKNLARVATAAAAKTGQSFEHMFDSIVVGTARSSRLLLDNLGIIVSVSEANKHYAESLKNGADAGKYANMSVKELADSLSDEAKKIAFVEEVGRKSTGMTNEMAKAGETASAKFDAFSASVQNLADALKKSLGGAIAEVLPPLTKSLAELAASFKEIQQLNWAQIGGAAWSGLVNGLTDTGTSPLSAVRDAAAHNRATSQITLDDLGAQIEDASGLSRRDALGVKLDPMTPVFDKMGQENEVLKENIRRFQELNRFLGNMYDAPAAKKNVDAVDPEKLAAARDKEAKARQKHVDDLEAYFRDEFAAREQINKQEDLLAKQDELELKAKEKHLSDMEDYFRDEFAARDEIAKQEDAFAKQEAAQKKAETDAFREAVTNFANIGSAVASGDAAGAIGGVATLTLDAIVPGLGALGPLIGQLLAPLKGVADLFVHLMNGVSSLIELGLGPLFDTLLPLGPALEIFLATIGQLIGSALRPLLPTIRIVVAGLAGFIDILSVVVAVLAPIVEIASLLATALFALGQILWSILEIFLGFFGINLLSFSDAIGGATLAIMTFTNGIQNVIVDINNAFVKFFQGLGGWLKDTLGTDLGLKNFGEVLEKSDLLQPPEPTDDPYGDVVPDNTDATEENTKAVRDLAREFRNLPGGYKVGAAFYQATTPGRSRYGNITGGNIQLANESFRNHFRTTM